MRHSLPPLDSFKAFEAAARHLSFSKAANELGVNKSAISYQIKKLEQHLGQPLFKRAVRQVKLTTSGQTLYQQSHDWLQQMQGYLAHLGQSQSLTIAVTTYTAVRWLSSRLTGFAQSYPHLQISMQHTVNQPQFDGRDVDLSIRWQHQHEPCNHFIPAPLFAVASPKLLAQLTHQQDWQSVVLLTETRQEDLWLEWNLDLQSNPRLIIEDANVRVQAAIDGQGLILADQLMQSELDAGTLIAIEGQAITGVGYGIHIHSQQANPLGDWLMPDKA